MPETTGNPVHDRINNAKSLFEVLGVPKTATEDEIKKAYRKAAGATHPDRSGGIDREGKAFKKAQEAYELLSDDKKRKAYIDAGGGSGDPAKEAAAERRVKSMAKAEEKAEGQRRQAEAEADAIKAAEERRAAAAKRSAEAQAAEAERLSKENADYRRAAERKAE